EEGIEIGLLGPLAVQRDGRALPLSGARLRCLLAVLAVRTNQVVPSDAIVDALWGDSPPASTTTALHVLVSRLRQALQPGRQARADDGLVSTVPPGYMLHAERISVDALCFEDDVASGRDALAACRWDDAVAAFGTALARWRGPALAEFADEFFAQGAVRR